MPRHDFSAPVKKLLAERVGYHCSNPSCGVATVGPSNVPDKKEYVGVAAHIYSASIDNGPRANPELTEEERSAANNGIHLCNKCSTIIDKNNGIGYSEVILFSWKKSAESAARARIYKNNSYTLFKNIEFLDLERNYSTALSCSGMGPKNVTACPSNRRLLDDIYKKLTLAYMCIVKGNSGSGKSLVTFQSAYDYWKKGWSVYELNKDLLCDSTVIAAPTEKSFIIIDDAQTIHYRYLESVLGYAHENLIILANWNTSTTHDRESLKRFPCVSIVSSVQVSLLKEYCKINKKHIESKLKSIGLNVNRANYYDCIDTRIERAGKEKTTWLFNYSLTEGWNAASNDLKLLHDDDHMNLVVVTVAVYQLATLDAGVSVETILTSLAKFKGDQEWLKKAHRIINEYCLVKDGVVNNKHYEYSRRVLTIFSSQKDGKEEKKYLVEALKKILQSSIFERGHANVLEFIMFDFRWCQYELNTTGFIGSLVTDLVASDKRDVSAAKISKLNSLIRFNKDVLNLLSSNSSVLDGWIFQYNRSTAYSLGNLFNTLYNEKYSRFPSSRKLVDFLLDSVVSAKINDKDCFSNVFNRAYMLLDKEDKEYATERLSNISFGVDISDYRAHAACYQFSSTICNLASISPVWASREVQNNIDGIAELLNNNLMGSYWELKDLIDSYFGVTFAILGIKNADANIARMGRELAKKISVDAILVGFETVEAVDVQNFSDIIIFMGLYNTRKFKEISQRFNYERLEKLYDENEKLDHYHRALVSLLRNRDSKEYIDHVSNIIRASDHIDSLFIELNSELSLERIENGVSYQFEFHDCSECASEIGMLRLIMKEKGSSFVQQMMCDIEQSLAETIFSASSNVDKKKGKFEFLIFIYIHYPDIYSRVFNDKKKNTILFDKIWRLLKGSPQEKNFARLYTFFIKEFSDECYSSIAEIEKKYPSAQKFDIAAFIN